MAIADATREVKARPGLVTAAVSVVGYALVAGVFLGLLPIPEISDDTVILLGDAIAVVNSVALLALLAGYRFIRRGQVARHRAAMLTAFSLILLFLLLYLLKVGGGFEKRLVAPDLVRSVYLVGLGVHLFLSVVSVPVVVYAVVLGLTHTPAELADTRHAGVGRWAVAVWTVSLALGILVYLVLNHLYAWEPAEPSGVSLAVALLVSPFRPGH